MYAYDAVRKLAGCRREQRMAAREIRLNRLPLTDKSSRISVARCNPPNMASDILTRCVLG
jgi:hypothetical protein